MHDDAFTVIVFAGTGTVFTKIKFTINIIFY